MDEVAYSGGADEVSIAVRLGRVVLLLALIGIEILILRRRKRGFPYPWRDAMISLGVSAGFPLSLALDTAVLGGLGVLSYEHRIFNFSSHNALTWIGAFLMLEFVLYWNHRWSHEIRWLWASHSVHHTPTDVILPTAIRLPWTGILQGNWLPRILLLAVGFPPSVIMGLLGLNLGYVFFIHSRLGGHLGPLEWILDTPTHHRIHHSSELKHHDSNYGAVLIIFDRMFGTFKSDTREPLTYGIYGADPAGSKSVVSAALGEWKNLLGDMWRSGGLLSAARVAMSRPGIGIDGKAEVASAPAGSTTLSLASAEVVPAARNG